MNRNGIKPESLQSEPEPSAPEFVSAVGDDSITRFDETRKRNKRNKRGRNRQGNRQDERQDRRQDERQDRRQGGRNKEEKKD